MSKQQCAFVQFTARASAEAAAEKSFNKLIINGRRLNIKWGRSQGQQLAPRPQTGEGDVPLEPVPGLPGGKLLNFEHAFLHCPPNSSKTGYAIEGALFISMQLSPLMLSASSEEVLVLIRLEATWYPSTDKHKACLPQV